MELELPQCRIRSWRPDDAESLARHANNRKIWLNLRDIFPHPYTVAQAESWIALAARGEPESHFAIEVNAEAAGGVGLVLQDDVHRYSAELGYWLGETHWGKGIMTSVIRRFTEYAFAAFELHRVFAAVFDWNAASCRILEKAGYQLEGRLRRSVIKDGHLLDQFVYAVTRS